MSFISPLLFMQVSCLTLLAILFLQSGLDKVFNYKGNLEWLQSHFAKSPLSGTVGLLMPAITILEVAAGVCAAIGVVTLLMSASTSFGMLGAQLSVLSILALFFGQRMAQQYDGAASLTTYFLISILTVYLLG